MTFFSVLPCFVFQRKLLLVALAKLQKLLKKLLKTYISKTFWDHSRFPPRKKRKKNNRRPTDNYQRRISYIREPAVESLFPPQLAFQPNQTEKQKDKVSFFQFWSVGDRNLSCFCHYTASLKCQKKVQKPRKFTKKNKEIWRGGEMSNTKLL